MVDLEEMVDQTNCEAWACMYEGEGREGERERGREGGREGGRERGRERV